MPCAGSTALLMAMVACPWGSLRIVPGEGKNPFFLRKTAQNAAAPHTSYPLGSWILAQSRCRKVVNGRGTKVVKSVY